jgi:thioesterase domain-containing protein
VAIRQGGTEPPIFCLHAQAGHLRLYHGLARYLDPNRPVYGVRGVLSNAGAGSAYRRFEDMAQQYVGEIQQVQPQGPYLLLGECDGAELAYETARQLCTSGDVETVLALVDSFGPGGPQRRWFASKATYRLVDSLRMVGFHLHALSRLDGRAARDYAMVRLARLQGRLVARIVGRRRAPSTELLRRQGFRDALAAYRPVPYGGRVLLFRGAKLPWGIERTPDLGWRSLVRDLDVVVLPCYFGTALLEPTVGLLARELERAMGTARKPG